MRSKRGFARALAAGVLLVAGCERERSAVLPRHQRLGILHDLVLYERPLAAGGPFFLDRFESTCADWRTYLVATGTQPGRKVLDLWGGAEPKPARRLHPMTRITWFEARAFAAWRLGRLPRSDEWQHAASAAGTSRYPWGDEPEPVRSNTGDLGLLELQPVGTFESGRDRQGVYDLFGNAAEWSQSVANEAWQDLVASAPAPPPALAIWSQGVPQPAFALLAQRIATPRLVLGGHFAAYGVIGAGPHPHADVSPWAWPRSPQEWGDTTGVRVAACPDELLCAVTAQPLAPSPEEEIAIRAFLTDAAHHSVLVATWRELRAKPGSGPWFEIVRAELER